MYKGGCNLFEVVRGCQKVVKKMAQGLAERTEAFETIAMAFSH